MPPREFVGSRQAFNWGHEFRRIFLHTVVVWKEGETFYLARLPERLEEPIDLNAIPTPPPIPTQHLCGAWMPGLTEAPHPLPALAYVKYPKLEYYNGSGIFGEVLLAEALVFEVLKTHPHHNICEYYGCVRDASGEYITGLCSKRYRCTLYHAVDSGEQFDRDAVIDGVRAGIEALHSLGLAHNDINPSNIMFDDEGRVVIIDFDSCRREGEKLVKGGTPNWSQESNISTRANDLYSLAVLVKFLTEGETAINKAIVRD